MLWLSSDLVFFILAARQRLRTLRHYNVDFGIITLLYHARYPSITASAFPRLKVGQGYLETRCQC